MSEPNCGCGEREYGEEPIGVVGLVGPVGGCVLGVLQKGRRTQAVGRLPGGQRRFQGEAVVLHPGVDLAGQAPAQAPDGFVARSFAPAACRWARSAKLSIIRRLWGEGRVDRVGTSIGDVVADGGRHVASPNGTFGADQTRQAPDGPAGGERANGGEDMPDASKAKERLQKRLEALGARVEDIKGDLRSAPGRDPEEQAAETAGGEVLASLENSALLEITQIRAALVRIDKGTYGTCVTCGEPIGEKRLNALPYATQCIGCAAK